MITESVIDKSMKKTEIFLLVLKGTNTKLGRLLFLLFKFSLIYKISFLHFPVISEDKVK